MEPELQKFRQRHAASSSNTANNDAISIRSSHSNTQPDHIERTASRKSENHAHAHFANAAGAQGDGGDDGDGDNGITREKTHESVYEPRNPYTYVGARGWRKYRPLRPFRGMYHDIKRRLPYYPSDFTDAITYRAVASTIRIYFVNLLPALAYTLDMYRRTGNFYGINEGLLASALAAGVFGVFSAQPLTIVGVTGTLNIPNRVWSFSKIIPTYARSHFSIQLHYLQHYYSL
ncbi:Boron transporter 4 [Orbilia blumenaviensis]|uniref:Boron transporter 4 n=1 Tax=Orbilia blumenaviensis TaxID=1796055 RepID=A0AAV9VN88_9PEZI